MRLALALVLSLAACRCADADRPDAQSLGPGSTTAGAAVGITFQEVASPAGRFWIARTANFRIQWSTSKDNLRRLAEACEHLAAASRRFWLDERQPQRWSPCCEIIVHKEVREYVHYLGWGSEQTSGCATIHLDQGRVVGRRIDLREDAADWETESLPHELMHVVLADRFSQSRIPPWADEGIAMLSESNGKLERRLAALRGAAVGGAVYSAGDLVAVRSSPEPASRNAFYGQSVALVSILLKRGTPAQLLDFVAESQFRDPETALQRVYGTASWSDLERSLREHATSGRLAQLTRPGGIRDALRVDTGLN